MDKDIVVKAYNDEVRSIDSDNFPEISSVEVNEDTVRLYFPEGSFNDGDELNQIYEIMILAMYEESYDVQVTYDDEQSCLVVKRVDYE